MPCAQSPQSALVSRLVGRRRCHPAISRPQLPTQPRLIITNPPPLKNARTSTRQQHSAALRARRLDSPAQTAPPHIHSPSRCARTKIGLCRPEQCQKELCGGDWRRAPPQLTCKQAPRGAVIRSQLRRRPPLVRSEAPPPLTNKRRFIQVAAVIGRSLVQLEARCERCRRCHEGHGHLTRRRALGVRGCRHRHGRCHVGCHHRCGHGWRGHRRRRHRRGCHRLCHGLAHHFVLRRDGRRGGGAERRRCAVGLWLLARHHCRRHGLGRRELRHWWRRAALRGHDHHHAGRDAHRLVTHTHWSREGHRRGHGWRRSLLPEWRGCLDVRIRLRHGHRARARTTWRSGSHRCRRHRRAVDERRGGWRDGRRGGRRRTVVGTRRDDEMHVLRGRGRGHAAGGDGTLRVHTRGRRAGQSQGRGACIWVHAFTARSEGGWGRGVPLRAAPPPRPREPQPQPASRPTWRAASCSQPHRSSSCAVQRSTAMASQRRAASPRR